MASNTDEIYEEKPYYETGEDKSKDEPFDANSDVGISPVSKTCKCACCRDDYSGCCSSYLILVYLFKAIISTSTLVLSYYFKELIEIQKSEEYEQLLLIFGLVGGIGSGILLISGSLSIYHGCDCPDCWSYVWITMFACFWVCFYGFISLLTNGAFCFGIAIIAATDIANIFIHSVKKFSIKPMLVLADFILIGTGFGVYLGLMQRFDAMIKMNLVFVAVWFIGKWLVLLVITGEALFKGNKATINPATYLMGYYCAWFAGVVFLLYLIGSVAKDCK